MLRKIGGYGRMIKKSGLGLKLRVISFDIWEYESELSQKLEYVVLNVFHS